MRMGHCFRAILDFYFELAVAAFASLFISAVEPVSFGTFLKQTRIELHGFLVR
jgi:hypothetical protein